MIPEIKPEGSPEPKTEITSEVPPEPKTEIPPEIPAQPAPEITPELPPAAVPRTRWQRLLHWEYFGLSIIVLVTLIFHFASIPLSPNIVWDEKWYVGDARSIISGTGELRPEHPPLAKLFIVAGDYIFSGFKTPEKYSGATVYQYVGSDKTANTIIQVSDATLFSTGQAIRIDSEQMDVKGVNVALNQITVERETGGTVAAGHNMLVKIYVFTDNAFEWRFFSIIIGTIGVIVFYFICRKLKFSWKIAMVATFLFAFEDMTFVHSGLALLDVYMVTFMLAAFLAYLDEQYLWMGVLLALSANCKMNGVLIFIPIFIHWAIYRRDKWKEFSISLAAAAVAFVFFLVWCDVFITHTIENPITRITSMLSATSANQFTIPKLSISSRPWTWIYPQFVNPEYNSPFIAYSYDPQVVISFISTTIQLLIVPTIGYLIYKAWKKSQTAVMLLLWFLATYLLWIPITIATNRVTFVFYFLPTTPAICIGIAMAISDWLDHLKKRRLELNRISTGIALSYGGIGLYLLIHLAIWIAFNPGIPTMIRPLLSALNVH